MKLNEIRDKVAAEVRGSKEAWLAKLHKADDMTDVRNVVHGFRGDRPVVLLMPLRTDRDDTLQAAWVAATAFGCDTIAFTSESWHPTKEHVEINPYTGRGWNEPLSMQTAADEHNALAEGVLIECLMTTVVNRAGDLTMITQDYKITRTTNALGITRFSVEWPETENGELDTLTDGVKATGVIPESLVEYMNRPTMHQEMAKAGLTAASFSLTEEQALAHQDCATVKYLVQTGSWTGAILLLADTPARAEVIDRSLGDLRMPL